MKQRNGLGYFNEDDKAFCLECNQEFICDRDIQLCDKCMSLFDVDKLWRMHDNNELDALDFNENKSMRDKFKIQKVIQ